MTISGRGSDLLRSPVLKRHAQVAFLPLTQQRHALINGWVEVRETGKAGPWTRIGSVL